MIIACASMHVSLFFFLSFFSPFKFNGIRLLVKLPTLVVPSKKFSTITFASRLKNHEKTTVASTLSWLATSMALIELSARSR